MFSWKFSEAYAIIDSWGEKEKLTGLVLKSRLLNHQGKFDVALETINYAILLAKENGDQINAFNGLAVKSNILLKLGKLQTLEELFQTGEELVKSFDPNTINQTIWAQSFFYHYYGIYLMLNGDMDQALDNFKRAMELKTKINDIRGLASSHLSLGNYYVTLGDFEKATNNINQSMVMYKEVNYPYGVALGLSSLGNMLRLTGKVIKSKEQLQKSLDVFLKVDGNPNPHVIAYCYLRIGRIHRLLNKSKKALSSFQKALEAVEEGSHPVTFVEIIFDIILLTIEGGQLSQTQKWNEKLKKISKNNQDNKLISLYVRFVEVVILRKSLKRLNDVVEAEKLFMSIIKEGVISQEINILAMIYYLEILFIEFRGLHNESILEDIGKYTTAILNIAKTQNSILLVIEVHILKSKIAYLRLNTEEAIHQLNTALSFASQNKLTFLTNKIEKERKLVQEYVTRATKMAHKDRSKSTRIDETDILNYLNEVSKVVMS